MTELTEILPLVKSMLCIKLTQLFEYIQKKLVYRFRRTHLVKTVCDFSLIESN